MRGVEEQEYQVGKIELEKASTYLIEAGSKFVKQNPIKFSWYIIGLLICLFFNGLKVDEEILDDYHRNTRQIDWDSLEKQRIKMLQAKQNFQSSQGLFWQCDNRFNIF